MSIAYDPAPLPPDADPVFPPILHGEKTAAGQDPFAKAIAAANTAEGVPGGTVFWSPRDDVMDVAIVLAPEAELQAAQAMLFAVAVGLGDAVGALAPPEVAILWDWPDGIAVNGAACGRFRMEASSRDLQTVPDWIAIGVTLQRNPMMGEPGHRPDVTSLMDEGCADLTLPRLIESWSRHTLVWINRWLDDGFPPLHEAWRGRARGMGEQIALTHGGARQKGLFLGLDENGDMLLKTVASTLAIPLTAMCDHPRPWPPVAGDGPQLELVSVSTEEPGTGGDA